MDELDALVKYLGRNLAKPCILTMLCPGDRGETDVMYRGKVMKASKASNVVKLFGSLETAIVYVNKAYVLARGRDRGLARALRLILASLMSLGFYVSTNDPFYQSNLYSLMCRASKLIFSISKPTPLGWVICMDELCSAINEGRAWIRWTERRAVANGDLDASKWLNIIGNQLFELMRLTAHEVHRGTRPVGRIVDNNLGDHWEIPLE
jgi:cob(I)alamin adenosyltransferase